MRTEYVPVTAIVTLLARFMKESCGILFVLGDLRCRITEVPEHSPETRRCRKWLPGSGVRVATESAAVHLDILREARYLLP